MNTTQEECNQKKLQSDEFVCGRSIISSPDSRSGLFLASHLYGDYKTGLLNNFELIRKTVFFKDEKLLIEFLSEKLDGCIKICTSDGVFEFCGNWPVVFSEENSKSLEPDDDPAEFSKSDDVVILEKAKLQNLNIEFKIGLAENCLEKIENIEIIDNLDELIECTSKLDLLSCDDDLFNFLGKILKAEYILEENFKDSMEGMIWSIISQLQKIPWNTELFNKLAIIAGRKFYSTPYPFIQYSEFKNDAFILEVENLVRKNQYDALFKLIAKKSPVWSNKGNVDKDFLKKAKLANKISGKIKLIPRNIAQYLDKQIVYIGNEPIHNSSKCIIYKTLAVPHEKWEKKEFELRENKTLREVKLYNRGKFESLYAQQLGLISNDPNLYIELRNNAIKEIQAYIKKLDFNDQWKMDLAKCGFEYIKILNKYEALIENFKKWYQTKNFKKFESFKQINKTFVTFYFEDAEQMVCLVEIFWSNPSITDISKSKEPRLSKLLLETPNLTEFTLISHEKITNLDLDLQIIETTSPEEFENSDLFYWNS